MRWTRQRRGANILRGRTTLMRTAKSCGPDAPTLASSSREASFLGATVARKPGHRGEREISRKTIAQGRPGDSGGPVVTNARAHYSTRAAAGATGTRLSLRPLFWGGSNLHNSGAIRRGMADAHLAVIASVAKQSILSSRSHGLLRRFAPRNDGNFSSSPAKAGDPVFRGVRDRSESSRRTGYPRFRGVPFAKPRAVQELNQKFVLPAPSCAFGPLGLKHPKPQSNPPFMRLCICQARRLRPAWSEAPCHITCGKHQPGSAIS
jgi:hypothetical protein